MDYVPAKTIVTRNKKPGSWFGFDYNMNIYRGCCHGCIYCDSRSDCYQVENFDQVRIKENALQIIRDDLRRKAKKGMVGTGAMSDPYNPFEEKEQLTRHALELISAYGFGAGIATKSHLVKRDIDVFQEIRRHSPVIIKMTITTFDDDLCKVIEPGAAVTSKRFGAVADLAAQGIFTGLLMMPLLPHINDTEENIHGIIQGAKDAGAKFIYPSMGLTMRPGQREYFYGRLDESFPGLKEKYISRYRNNYVCSSPKAKDLYTFFKKECEKAGILTSMRDIIAAYWLGYEQEQLKLF